MKDIPCKWLNTMECVYRSKILNCSCSLPEYGRGDIDYLKALFDLNEEFPGISFDNPQTK